MAIYKFSVLFIVGNFLLNLLCSQRRVLSVSALNLRPHHQSPSNHERPISNNQRRNFLTTASTGLLAAGGLLFLEPLTTISPASASEVRPTSKELLRPPIRVKLFIDQAVAICQSAVNDKSNQNKKEALTGLQKYLLKKEQTSFMTSQEEKMARLFLEIDTTTPWQQARLKEREDRGKELGVDYTTPYDRLNTAIQSWGDKRQFQILSDRQRKLERASPMRAAFNGYTNNLVFGDSYQLNVQGQERSKLIRDNALPDVNAVVVSDLDLRDLYRNQILERMEDANAELDYQLNNKTGDDGVIDAKEVLSILQSAQASCKDWFSFVPSEDVEEAMKAVMQEQEQENAASIE